MRRVRTPLAPEVDRTRADLEKVAHDCGPHCLVHPADVGDEDAVETMIATTLDRYDRIDVLVNNAGTVVQGDLTEIKTSDYRRIMATLVDGTFFCIRAALPYLVRTKGRG
ncbi:SDR family oxidoreductase [Paracoccus laeviglucosivorans]|nr:SDR family oxidoreductase [Paracoccus laeviglucosivorans]